MMSHAKPNARRLRRSAGLLSVTALATSALTVSLALATAPAQAASHSAQVHYTFKEIDNQDDPTFNQLLGINNSGEISGYFGSGIKGHPNKGYTLEPPYKQVDFRNQNFPGSKQTQVTGLNNTGIQVGFWSHNNMANVADNDNFGYYSINGTHFHKVNFPAKHPASPPVDQLLGVNDSGLAVGFYVDSAGNSHAYLYDIPLNKYISYSSGISGVTSSTASGINAEDSICGFVTLKNGDVESFLVRKASPHLFVIKYPGATATNAFGVNKFGEVVGTYTTGPSSAPLTFGFTWSHGKGFQKINYPGSMNGTTFVNGVNDAGDLVGFYNGMGGNTNGFIAKP
jgi:hypothetical protein